METGFMKGGLVKGLVARYRYQHRQTRHVLLLSGES
jgi:hypothetical protein